MTTSAKVVQVSISPGGVPKLPVDRAWVGELGLEGDAHREMTVHGGPYRAVCLFAMEAIDRLRAEGHPVQPGSVGENLTTRGIEWSLLPGGTRARIGADLVIELVDDATPCDTQRPNFIRGEFKRISRVLYPADARMYARVVVAGEVRPGDAIEVLPLPAGHDERAWVRLFDIDLAELAADQRLWLAARGGGVPVEIVVDDELAMASSSATPEPPFNHAVGLRTVPQMLPRVLDFYRDAGVAGRFGLDRAPWPGATPVERIAVLGADAAELAGVDVPARDERAARPNDLTLRRLGPNEADAWSAVILPVVGSMGFDVDVWRALLPGLLATRNVTVIVAEEHGEPIAAGLVSTHRKVGLLRSGVVLAAARGRGLHLALIRERIRTALDDGCAVVAAHAGVDTVSERNLQHAGLRRLWTRDVYAFDPDLDPVPQLTERAVLA